VGAALMAVALAHRPLRSRAGPMLLWSVAGFGVCTILFGVSTSLVLSLIALICLGAADMISVIIRATLVQLRTPDEMRGRVMAVEYGVYRYVQRTRTIRVRINGAMVWHCSGRSAGRRRTLLIIALWGLDIP